MGHLIKRGQLPAGRKKLSVATGISERSIRTCLERLKRSGEITIKTSSKFSIITICNYDKYQTIAKENDPQVVTQTTSDRPAADQQSTTLKEIKKERSEENNNSSQNSSLSCPHLKIVDIYNETLSGKLPQVKPDLWNGTRRSNLKARWVENKDRQNLSWWKEYFESVKKTPFLVGVNDRGWKADLGWLVNQNSMSKVLEGKYENKSQTNSFGGTNKRLQ